MLSMIEAEMRVVEQDPRVVTRDDCFRSLAGRIGLDDFGEIMLAMPDSRFLKLSDLLPSMASVDTQNLWTGANGYDLLRQTANFVRSVSYNCVRINHRDIDGCRILDYGCGYGRIARLMWYFTSTENLFGVDPWDRSIQECEQANMGPNFRLSSYLPSDLPVDGRVFDLAYAFSVFTHLSKEATLAAMSAVRRHVVDGGVFVITIRPIEYWYVASRLYGYETASFRTQHEDEGFAFCAQPGNAGSSGEATYGDTSITLDWIRANVPGWTIRSVDRSLEDAYQIYVFLQAI